MSLWGEDESQEDVSESERLAIRRAAVSWANTLGHIAEDYLLRRQLAWRPHLYCAKTRTAIHIMFYPGIQRTIADSLAEAQQRIRGLSIALVGPEAFLRTPSVLESAAAVGASITILKGPTLAQAVHYRDVFEAIFREGLVLGRETYTSLATRALEAALTAKRAEKGRWLERLLGFVTSQVPGFSVLATNYNTATEEIDVVVSNRRVSGMFMTYSGPLILAECKNRVEKAGKNEYVSLATKIRNRRQAVSIGLFVSVNGYTTDFRLEALRDSRDRFVIARFGKAQLEEWVGLCGEDAAQLVERQIQDAVLD